MRFDVLIWQGSELDLRADLRDAALVQLEVHETDGLVQIAEQAKASIGAVWSSNYYRFLNEPDAEGRRFEDSYLLAYVNSSGSLGWTRGGLDTVTVADVLRTRDAGLFDSDPLALLVEEPRGGDGVLAHWDDVITFVKGASAAYGAWQLGAATLKRLVKVFGDAQRNWNAINAQPDALLRIVASRDDWDYPLLAQYLDISLAAAITLLEALGYKQVGGSTRYVADPTSDAWAFRQELLRRFAGGEPKAHDVALRKMQGR